MEKYKVFSKKSEKNKSDRKKADVPTTKQQ